MALAIYCVVVLLLIMAYGLVARRQGRLRPHTIRPILTRYDHLSQFHDHEEGHDL
jgi:hypothetical protein